MDAVSLTQVTSSALFLCLTLVVNLKQAVTWYTMVLLPLGVTGVEQVKEFTQEHHWTLEKARLKWQQDKHCSGVNVPSLVYTLSLYSHGSQRADTGGWRAWQCLHFYSTIHSVSGTYADGKGTKKTPLACNLSGAIFNCDAMIRCSS